MTIVARLALAVAARGLVVLAAVVVAVFAAATPAQAHPTLLFTTPADTAEATSPTTIVLVFNEPVSLGANALTILDPGGAPTPVERVATAKDGTTVAGTISRSLAPGVYTLR